MNKYIFTKIEHVDKTDAVLWKYAVCQIAVLLLSQRAVEILIQTLTYQKTESTVLTPTPWVIIAWVF